MIYIYIYIYKRQRERERKIEREYMRKQNQLAGLCQISKNKLKFHYFKDIFYLYFVKTFLNSSK